MFTVTHLDLLRCNWVNPLWGSRLYMCLTAFCNGPEWDVAKMSVLSETDVYDLVKMFVSSVTGV